MCGSMHFHMKKHETMLVIEGELLVRLIDPDDGSKHNQRLGVGDSIEIPEGHVHSLTNTTGEVVRLVEFSTQHFESDSYRVEPNGTWKDGRRR
jgi:mannose-6-phosphate isomerase-like protein (cupin superfamily)